MQPANKAPPERRIDPTAESLLPTHKRTDPVCAMSVEPSHAAGSVVHDGRTYYFCSKLCREKFLADPAKFTADTRQSSALPPSTGGTIYTCPMHPEVRQDHPGTCSKCGMSLELVGDAPAATKVEYSSAGPGNRQPGFADQIDVNFIQMLECCAPLHDIGKAGLPDEILLKPGKLTPGKARLGPVDIN